MLPRSEIRLLSIFLILFRTVISTSHLTKWPKGWQVLNGGPLYLGDLEDYKGTCHVMCPWHSYMFDLATGKNDIGIQQEVFDVKVDDGDVYILYNTELSLHRYPDTNYKRSNSCNSAISSAM